MIKLLTLFLASFNLLSKVYSQDEIDKTSNGLPLVSVLMASFNRDLYLDMAIQSIRN